MNGFSEKFIMSIKYRYLVQLSLYKHCVKGNEYYVKSVLGVYIFISYSYV